MANFRYRARDAEGSSVVGTVRGSSAEGVTESLAAQGLEVEEVVAQKRSILSYEITPSKIKRDELANFSRQMAAFVGAGVPMLDALDIIGQETSDKTLKKVVYEVSDSLRFGESFAGAMAAQKDAFPAFYIAVLQSAEATGDLQLVLAQLSHYIERDNDARKKIRSSLVYPILVLVFAVVTIGVLTIVVLPQFKTFFESFHAKLPLATRMLVSITDWLDRWWPALLVLGLLGAAAAVFGPRTHRGRLVRDRFMLAIPVAGDVVKFSVIERFCRVLSAMLRAGVPMPDALSLATNGANNLVYQESLTSARTEILEGAGISGPISRTKLFPTSMTQMMRVGEETGTLDDQLETMASYYGTELEYKLKRLTSVFEPVMVIFVGLVVGFVAIALVSAIYGIYNQVDIK